MRHSRVSLVLAGLALFACGGSESPREPAREPATGEEPPGVALGSTPGATVVVLGTSLTAGMGLDDPSLESWPGQLQALADSAGIPVDVRNAGVSGDTSAGGLRRLEWLLQDPPSVLIVELGANDGLRGLDLGALEDNLRSIVALTLEANAATRVFLAAMEAPPNLGASYTSRFREVFPRVAQDTGAGLIPFILDGVAGVPGMNQADAIHPTAEGHRRIARNAWEILEPAFRAAAEEGEGR